MTSLRRRDETVRLLRARKGIELLRAQRIARPANKSMKLLAERSKKSRLQAAPRALEG